MQTPDGRICKDRFEGRRQKLDGVVREWRGSVAELHWSDFKAHTNVRLCGNSEDTLSSIVLSLRWVLTDNCKFLLPKPKVPSLSETAKSPKYCHLIIGEVRTSYETQSWRKEQEGESEKQGKWEGRGCIRNEETKRRCVEKNHSGGKLKNNQGQ